MKERIKEIRKSLNLSQENFGEKLGLSKSAISNMESGRYNVTDTIIISICNIFKVNEEWIRNGTGEMYSTISDNSLDRLIDEYNLDEVDKRILKMYLTLNEDNKEAFKKVIVALASEYYNDEDLKEVKLSTLKKVNKNIEDTIPSDELSPTIQKKIEKKVELYRNELIDSQKGRILSATQMQKENIS